MPGEDFNRDDKPKGPPDLDFDFLQKFGTLDINKNEDIPLQPIINKNADDLKKLIEPSEKLTVTERGVDAEDDAVDGKLENGHGTYNNRYLNVQKDSGYTPLSYTENLISQLRPPPQYHGPHNTTYMPKAIKEQENYFHQQYHHLQPVQGFSTQMFGAFQSGVPQSGSLPGFHTLPNIQSNASNHMSQSLPVEPMGRIRLLQETVTPVSLTSHGLVQGSQVASGMNQSSFFGFQPYQFNPSDMTEKDAVEIALAISRDYPQPYQDRNQVSELSSCGQPGSWNELGSSPSFQDQSQRTSPAASSSLSSSDIEPDGAPITMPSQGFPGVSLDSTGKRSKRKIDESNSPFVEVSQNKSPKSDDSQVNHASPSIFTPANNLDTKGPDSDDGFCIITREEIAGIPITHAENPNSVSCQTASSEPQILKTERSTPVCIPSSHSQIRNNIPESYNSISSISLEAPEKGRPIKGTVLQNGCGSFPPLSDSSGTFSSSASISDEILNLYSTHGCSSNVPQVLPTSYQTGNIQPVLATIPSEYVSQPQYGKSHSTQGSKPLHGLSRHTAPLHRNSPASACKRTSQQMHNPGRVVQGACKSSTESLYNWLQDPGNVRINQSPHTSSVSELNGNSGSCPQIPTLPASYPRRGQQFNYQDNTSCYQDLPSSVPSVSSSDCSGLVHSERIWTQTSNRQTTCSGLPVGGLSPGHQTSDGDVVYQKTTHTASPGCRGPSQDSAGGTPATSVPYLEDIVPSPGSCVSESEDEAFDDKIDDNTVVHYFSYLPTDKVMEICQDNKQFVGEHINARNRLHQTPLYVAVMTKNCTTACLLVQLGADPSLQGLEEKSDVMQAPLHKAVVLGDVRIVDILLSSQLVDIEQQRIVDRKTPLMVALHGHNWQNEERDRRLIIRLLIEKGASVEKLDEQSDKTVLMMAIETRDIVLVEYILKHIGVGETRDLVNRANRAGNTSLHIAAGLTQLSKEDHLDLLKMLVYFGGNTDAVNLDNKTPKDWKKNLFDEMKCSIPYQP